MRDEGTRGRLLSSLIPHPSSLIPSAQLLLPQQLVDPAPVLVAEPHRRVALVVDLGGEAALVVAAGERRVQVEDGVAVVGGQGQAEAGEALLQGGGVDLVLL